MFSLPVSNILNADFIDESQKLETFGLWDRVQRNQSMGYITIQVQIAVSSIYQYYQLYAFRVYVYVCVCVCACTHRMYV